MSPGSLAFSGDSGAKRRSVLFSFTVIAQVYALTTYLVPIQNKGWYYRDVLLASNKDRKRPLSLRLDCGGREHHLHLAPRRRYTRFIPSTGGAEFDLPHFWVCISLRLEY
jgi:hypothetical protein